MSSMGELEGDKVSVGTRVSQQWAATGVAGRLWWLAAGSLGVAAVLVLGLTWSSDAAPSRGSGGTSQAAAGTSSRAPSGTAAPAGSSGSMAGMPGMGAASGITSATPGASTASTICSNVANTTTMADGMVMAPVPSGSPTAAEQAAANQRAAQTAAALTKFTNLSAATAAGYVPATNPNGYVVHYANWQTVKSGDVLDPNHPSALVYANTVRGPVLLGAMYMGAGPCQPGPDVGGPLTQWHAHDNLCLSTATRQVVGRTSASGTCASGVHNTNTYFMLHVWTAPALADTHQFQPDLTKAEMAPIIQTGQP
jgi:hypothetical protein